MIQLYEIIYNMIFDKTWLLTQQMKYSIKYYKLLEQCMNILTLRAQLLPR